MPGSTPLADYAGRVQQQYDRDAEQNLSEALDAWLDGSSRIRQRLGEPSTIVLETDLVPSLAARLRSAPWLEVVTAAPGSGCPAPAAGSAVTLLALVISLVHPPDDDFGSSARSSAHVLWTLLRQVCTWICS